MQKADKKTWAGRILSALMMAPFVLSLVMKLRPTPESLQGAAHLGIPATLNPTLAILEGLCIVLYLIPQTAVLGAVLFTGYLGGAICAHLRVGDPIHLQALFGVLIWLGIWLREPRLRQVLPIRR